MRCSNFGSAVSWYLCIQQCCSARMLVQEKEVCGSRGVVLGLWWIFEEVWIWLVDGQRCLAELLRLGFAVDSARLVGGWLGGTVSEFCGV